MSDERLPNIHPGEILHIEFLEPLQITPYRLSKDIGVAQTRISEILSGQRSITADTAWRLSRYFGNSAQFWLNLQAEYDLRQAQLENRETYLRIECPCVWVSSSRPRCRPTRRQPHKRQRYSFAHQSTSLPTPSEVAHQSKSY